MNNSDFGDLSGGRQWWIIIATILALIQISDIAVWVTNHIKYIP